MKVLICVDPTEMGLVTMESHVHVSTYLPVLQTCDLIGTFMWSLRLYQPAGAASTYKNRKIKVLKFNQTWAVLTNLNAATAHDIFRPR